MIPNTITASDFVEIVSYDAYMVGIGLAAAGHLIQDGGSIPTHGADLKLVAAGLAVIGTLLWRLSSSIADRE